MCDPAEQYKRPDGFEACPDWAGLQHSSGSGGVLQWSIVSGNLDWDQDLTMRRRRKNQVLQMKRGLIKIIA